MAAVAPETVDVPLLKDEASSMGLMMAPGIATITFYKGDVRAAEPAMQAQLAKVVAANPWLAGKLVKSKAHGVVIRHPVEPSEADLGRLFFASSSPAGGAADKKKAFKLAPGTPYMKLCADLYKSSVIVGSGAAIVGKEKYVSSLTLAESSEAGSFALVFSLSHSVGDGRTYYEVLSMLRPGADVRALSSARVMGFGESMRDQCDRKPLEWVDKPATLYGMTCGMCCNPKAKVYAFYLDDEKLAAAKAAGAQPGGDEGSEKESGSGGGGAAVPCVSTNDVLTSGFFKECGTRIGMMGMDCRGRLEGVGADLAGNYVTALVLDAGAFGSPAALRRLLQKGPPYTTITGKLPSCAALCCAAKANRFAMASNWSAFAKGGGLVALDGCELSLHLPVQPADMLTFDNLIPFASGVGRVGVLCATVSTDEAGLRASLPVGDVISTELFPDK